MRAVQVTTEAGHYAGQAYILWSKELKLLKTTDGRGLYDGVWVLLDDGTTGQTSCAGCVHAGGGILELWAERGDERTETLAQALVDGHTGRGRGH